MATRLPLSDLLQLIPLGACLLTLLRVTQGLIGRRGVECALVFPADTHHSRALGSEH